MSLSTDRLPNIPLSGPELKQYAVQLLVDELESRSVPESVLIQMSAAMQTAMDQDYLFGQGTSYPRAVIILDVKLHVAAEQSAFSIEPAFQLSNPLAPKHSVMVRAAAPPLKDREGPESVECFTLTAKTENPNLIRVHYRIPILTSTRVEPRPGELFGRIETSVIDYDPADFPDRPEAPEVVDHSEEFAAAWGIVTSATKIMEAWSVPNVGGREGITSQSQPVPLEKRGGRKKGWNKA